MPAHQAEGAALHLQVKGGSRCVVSVSLSRISSTISRAVYGLPRGGKSRGQLGLSKPRGRRNPERTEGISEEILEPAS
jgi:hypothetical protein